MRNIPVVNPHDAKNYVELFSSTIARFQVAATMDGEAVWNAKGSQAMANLLLETAERFDAHVHARQSETSQTEMMREAMFVVNKISRENGASVKCQIGLLSEVMLADLNDVENHQEMKDALQKFGEIRADLVLFMPGLFAWATGYQGD